jgi:hypothetical protein
VSALVGWLGVAGVAFWAGFSRGTSPLGRPRIWFLGIAIGTPVILLAFMFGLSVLLPDAPRFFAERIGFRCAALTMADGVPILLALAWMRRGSDPVHPVSAGAALGAACGAAAGVMVEGWCPVANLLHVVLGHVGPIVVLAALGAALGNVLIAIRSNPRF